MNYRSAPILLCLGGAFLGGLGGCRSTPEAKDDSKKECRFTFPQSREALQDYVEYTGRTAAKGAVDIKARVTGVLKEVRFQEGAVVRKDQELFLIDPEPYVAQLEQAQAQAGLYDAQVRLTTRTYEQKLATKQKNPDSITDLDLRTAEAQMKEAQAAFKAAEASLKIYQLNKDFTTVKSPIDGVVGRLNQAPGNVILQDQTLLTTVVSLEPIYVYFDMDAATFAKFHAPQGAKAAPTEGARNSVTLELPANPSSASGDAPAEVPGTIDFFNNPFNPATDTLLVRGVFANPQKDAAPPLRPGMFVRVKVMIGAPYSALLVPDPAILRKMGKEYVYVVDADNRVKEVPVVIGQLQDKGLRVIKGGQLTVNDRVIVSRLLEIQPKQEIVPVPRPADAAAAGQESGVRNQGSGVRGQRSGVTRQQSGAKKAGP